MRLQTALALPILQSVSRYRYLLARPYSGFRRGNGDPGCGGIHRVQKLIMSSEYPCAIVLSETSALQLGYTSLLLLRFWRAGIKSITQLGDRSAVTQLLCVRLPVSRIVLFTSSTFHASYKLLLFSSCGRHGQWTVLDTLLLGFVGGTFKCVAAGWSRGRRQGQAERPSATFDLR